MRKILGIILATFLTVAFLFAAERANDSDQNSLKKPQTVDQQLIDVNTISAWLTNKGSFFRNPFTGNAGFEYPINSDIYSIYASGLWIGGKVNNEVRVAIAEYSYEYNPGTMNEDGTWNDPEDSRYRVYKVTRDDYLAATDGDATTVPGEDWINWPAQDGAPTTEWVDQDGNTQIIPKMLGDQLLWTVYNDADPDVHINMGSGPLGVEIQQMVWGYNKPGAMGNTVFVKFTLLNKSGKDIEDCYVSVWSDPDLGDSGDDFVGCDTTLNLGLCYNSSNNDGEYGPAPPAIGYDFFQGPIIPSTGDTAIFNFGKRADYKNLAMSSFVYYNNDRSNNGNPFTPQDVYNYQQALWIDGTPITFGGTGTSGTERAYFMYPSDPENPEAPVWLDSAPADRRFMQNIGPFTMAAGDTQEVVIGVIAARGSNNLNSVTLVKNYDAFAQNAFDINFELPIGPTAPKVTATALDREIMLTWDNSVESYSELYKVIPEEDAEGNALQQDYLFEGYIVYQFQDVSYADGKTLAIYDLAGNSVKEIWDFTFDSDVNAYVNKPVVKGKDSGLKRFQRITEDVITNLKDKTLINGRTYYYGVQAYAYTPDGPDGEKLIFSPLAKVQIQPKSPSIGTRFSSTFGDTIAVTKTGPSDGSTVVIVVDPSKTTGMGYTITFESDTVAHDGSYMWNLVRSDGTVILNDQRYQAGDVATDDRFSIVDGLLVKVAGPPPGLKTVVQVANAGGPLTEPDWDASGAEFGGNNVWHSLSAPSDVNRFYVSAGGGEGTIDRMARSIANAEGHDYEVRFSDSETSLYGAWYGDDSYEYIPLTAWDVGVGSYDDATDDVRALTGGGVVLGGFANFAAYNDPYFGYPATDWLYLRVPTGPGGTYGPYETDFTSGTLGYAWWDESKEVLARIIFGDYGGGAVLPEAGTVVRWITNKPNSELVEYTFTSPAAMTVAANDQKADINKINVYPNPYYGAHPLELNQFSRFVKFTNLPPTCTVRIFDLAGELVRKIERKNVTDSEQKWDLNNAYNLPVASGIYIYHVDVPGIGEKIGKVAILAPEQRLNTF